MMLMLYLLKKIVELAVKYLGLRDFDVFKVLEKKYLVNYKGWCMSALI